MKPKLYTKSGCPFSLKVLILLAENQLLEYFDLHHLKEDSDEIVQTRKELTELTAKPANFPSMIVSDTELITDSDEISAFICKTYDIDINELIVSPIYTDGVLSMYINMVKKIKTDSPDFFQ